jgi:hypothetical protein
MLMSISVAKLQHFLQFRKSIAQKMHYFMQYKFENA